MTRRWDPYSAGKCTRWQDDKGDEYLIPSSQTTGFRCNVLNLRRPPLLCESNGDVKPMALPRWEAWQPKLRRAFEAIYGVYRVPDNQRTGTGRVVQTLKRYQKTEDKYRGVSGD